MNEPRQTGPSRQGGQALQSAAPSATGADGVEASTMRLVSRRFMPLLLAAYIRSYLDRVNIGFAALTANHDLGLSETGSFPLGLLFLAALAAIGAVHALGSPSFERWQEATAS